MYKVCYNGACANNKPQERGYMTCRACPDDKYMLRSGNLASTKSTALSLFQIIAKPIGWIQCMAINRVTPNTIEVIIWRNAAQSMTGRRRRHSVARCFQKRSGHNLFRFML